MKKMKTFGNSKYTVTVETCKVFITDENGKRPAPDEVVFVLQKGGREMREDKHAITVEMTMDEAKELAGWILELAGKIQEK